MSNNLEKRLQALENERGVLATMYAYAHSIDYGLKEAFADCFTEDACYLVKMRGVPSPQLPGGPQPPTGLKGRPAILNYVKAHTNAPNLWHKHFGVEPVIRFESDTEATAQTYFARLDEDDKGAFISAFGRYVDRLVKSPDGKWRFKERICEVESRRAVR